MSKAQKTIIERLDEMIATNSAVVEEVQRLRADLNKLTKVLEEKETSPHIEVKTSTAEEIKEALKPIMGELIMRRRQS